MPIKRGDFYQSVSDSESEIAHFITAQYVAHTLMALDAKVATLCPIADMRRGGQNF